MFGLLGLLIGIFLVLIGGYMIFFFPLTSVHQEEYFGKTAIVLGFICLIVGGILIFIP